MVSTVTFEISSPKEFAAMPRACAICGKTAAYGYNVSHSKVHTHRRFDANLHPAVIDGVKLLVCTRCRRTQTKDARMAKKRERARRQNPVRADGTLPPPWQRYHSGTTPIS